MTQLGKGLVFFGVLLVLAGLAVMVFPKIPFVGRLPGDILVKRDNFTLFFPITTCILISVLLTFLFSLFGKK